MKKKRTGVITVEAVLVMPVVMGVILLLYSLIVIQYNNVIFRTAAIRTTNRIGANWNQLDSESNILKEDMASKENKSGANVVTSDTYADNDPYAPVLQLLGVGKEQRISQMSTYYNYMLEQALSSDFTLFNMELGGGNTSDFGPLQLMFGGTFDITVINNYDHALIKILEGWGYDVHKMNTATVKASFNDPVEFVRNIGFARDVIEDLKKKKEGK